MNTLLICLQNETKAMAALVDVLNQEQAALKQAPTVALMEEINEITQKKNQLVGTISQLGQLRNNELVQLGFRQSESNLPNWLVDKQQIQSWEALMVQTKKAKELNRVNGLLINRHLIRNQNTLQVLYQNHNPNPAPNLYGANGQSSTERNLIRGVIV